MTSPPAAPPGERAPVRAWTPGAPAAAPAPAQPAGGAGSGRGLALGAAAMLLALGGFALLGDEARRLWGGALLGAAAVLSLLAWGGVRPRPAFGDAASASAAPDAGRRRRLALAGIALAGALIAAADLEFRAYPDETFGLSGVLWLLGLAVLLIAAGAWPPDYGSRLSPGTLSPRAVQAVENPKSKIQNLKSGAPWTRAEVAVFAGLVALALLLRVWDLTNIPYNIYPDEIMTGTVATQAYLGGANPPVFSTLWGGIDLPALWFFLIAGTLKIGGVTLATLRLPAALFGAAAVIPFYGFVRGVWGRAAAIAGSAVMAFSAADIHYSRVALNNILPQFFWAACFLFLLRGLRRRRPLDWALAGVLGGVSEYGYYGTRLLPFVLVAFFGYLLVIHWRRARALVGHFALLALGYVAGFGPLLAYYSLHPAAYMGRPTGTQILSRVVGSWPDVGAMAATVWPPFSEALLGINSHPSQDLVYFAPLLLAGEAALLVLGSALLIWQWRHPAAFLLLLSGWGTLFVGGALVLYSAPPFLAHLTPGFPAIYAAIGLPFQGIARHLPGEIALGRRPLRLPRAALVIGPLLLILGLLDWIFYFRQYYADPHVLTARLQRPQMNYEIQAAQSRWQATLGPAYKPYIVGRTAQPYDGATTSYLVTAPPAVHVWDVPADLPDPAPPGQGMAFVFYADTVQFRDQIAARFPGGMSGEADSPDGRPLFYSYVLAPPP